MPDAEEKTAEQLATEISGSQNAQVDVAEDTSQSSAGVQATNDEDYGKFTSLEQLRRGYQELEHKLRTTRPVDPSFPPRQPAASPPAIFDEETLAGIDTIVERKLELKRAEEFARNHREELADPLLKGAVFVEIQDANLRGEYISQETALANAKKSLEVRLAPKVEAASQDALEEGKSIARRKEQAGAVGSTNGKVPEVDPETLNAEDYAVYMGLK